MPALKRFGHLAAVIYVSVGVFPLFFASEPIKFVETQEN